MSNRKGHSSENGLSQRSHGTKFCANLGRCNAGQKTLWKMSLAPLVEKLQCGIDHGVSELGENASEVQKSCGCSKCLWYMVGKSRHQKEKLHRSCGILRRWHDNKHGLGVGRFGKSTNVFLSVSLSHVQRGKSTPRADTTQTGDSWPT